MAEEFVGMTIAVVIVTASIVLAGILIGLGRALNYKKIENFGIEELIQSIINAAIIGSFAAIIQLVSTINTGNGCIGGPAIDQLACVLGGVNNQIFNMFQELIKANNALGYYQTLQLNFGAFMINPFGNLSAVSSMLSGELFLLNAIMILVQMNAQIVFFIKANALALIFPIGLVFRTFFATRKIGGYLIALALGLFIFYPSFVMIFPSPQTEIQNSTMLMQGFNNNTFYAATPIIDLNNNYAIAGKIDIMSGRCTRLNMTNSSACIPLLNQTFTNMSNTTSVDFTGDIGLIVQSNSSSLAKTLLYTAIAPLFSLILTIFFIRELGGILGSDVGLKTISSI